MVGCFGLAVLSVAAVPVQDVVAATRGTGDDVRVEPESRQSGYLAVGDPARSAIGRAVLGSLLLLAVFFAFIWIAKELPGLYVHEPWQDDPYDAMVSVALWSVPLLMGVCGVRVALCRRLSVLPARRALDALRVSRLLVAIVVLTLTGNWVSVVLRSHRDAWSQTTVVLLGLLGLLTAFAAAAGLAVRQGRRALLQSARVAAQPDWLADAVALGERETGRLGPWREPAMATVRWVDRRVVARVRRHPLRAAAVFSIAFGVAIDTPQLVLEGYTPGLALLFFAVSASTVFAFIVIAGAELGFVERRGRSGRAVLALVASAASVPLSASFRGSLWWIVGTTDRDAGVGQFALLVLVVAVGTAALVIFVEPLFRGHRRPRSEVR